MTTYLWVIVSQVLQIQQYVLYVNGLDFLPEFRDDCFASLPHFEVLVTLPVFTYLINSNFRISNFSLNENTSYL